MEITGKASTTIAGGDVVWENDKFVPRSGSGKFIPRISYGFPYERSHFLDRERDYTTKIIDRSVNSETIEHKLQQALTDLSIAKSKILTLES